MSDFGEEHLKFMFERWKVKENLQETENQSDENSASIEEFIQQAAWFEARLNRSIGSLEKWMEGTNEKLSKLDKTEE